MPVTPITLTNEDCEKLLRRLRNDHLTPQQDSKCIRNYCIAVLMLDAGLRVGEVVQLYQIDLLLGTTPVTALRITADIAKNHKERIVPLTERIRNTSIEMSNRWWEQDESGNHFAFYSGDNSNQSLTTRQVERIIRVAAMKSLGRPVHPHVLRHTFASRLMRTTNARIVQELLGHTHLSTTQIYTHPNQDDLKKAIDQLGQGEIETGLPPV